ncbi:divalent-cation tolerance protein CutA [Vandammella animalimorsus]|uniref:Cytochrome C biogenesis protein n=1 Tax=Vandammella animalimorsus TaxID=2029117 RepID=A0A2A2ADX8_9BURK|nr:divalent-cation tolerance protein CutA [Vandammella animalimorsus]PAT35941.1 cytochrome C biogenesis protein [Vandammella animalimorsus]
MELLIVVTTVAQQADARRLAQQAVIQGLAACVHIDAINSVYQWQGQVEQQPEWRLWFKTTPKGHAALCDWLQSQHPYELPALYTLSPSHIAAPFGAWLQGQVRTPQEPVQNPRQ